MRLLHAGLPVLLLALGCVRTPDNPFDDGDGDGGVPTGLCNPNCPFPPTDEGFATKLLPAIVADVDNNDDNDLVVGNGPAGAANSDYWGFFFIRNVATQTGELRAAPFQKTQFRPRVIHVEQLGPEQPRIYVFGDDGGDAAKLEIYTWDPIGGEFILDGETDAQNDLPLTPDDGEEETPMSLTGGEFDSFDPGPDQDVALAIGNQVWVSLSGSSGFTELDLAGETGTGLVDSEIQIVSAQTSPYFTPGFRNLVGEGRDDLMIAADGAVRWFSFSLDSGSGPDWRSITEFPAFPEGVMGNMLAASAADVARNGLPSENRIDLVLGGPGSGVGSLDVTEIRQVTSDSFGFTVEPAERYEWDGAVANLTGKEVLMTSADALIGVAAHREIVLVTRTSATPDEILLWLLTDVTLAEETMNLGDRGTLTAEGGVVSVPLGFMPVSVIPVAAGSAGQPSIVVFAADGRCASYALNDVGQLLESGLSCTANP